MKAFKLEVPSELRCIPLVGNYFRSAASQKLLKDAKEFDLVFMKRDPNNQKDKNAVRMSLTNKGVLTLVGFAQRHAAQRMTNFLKVVPNCDIEDFIVGGLHLLGEEHEVIPFGIVGAKDAGEMVKRYADSRERYETLLKKILGV